MSVINWEFFCVENFSYLEVSNNPIEDKYQASQICFDFKGKAIWRYKASFIWANKRIRGQIFMWAFTLHLQI